MQSSYNIQRNIQRTEESSTWGKEKLDWWWLILLITIVITIITLITIGFYSLPETSHLTPGFSDYPSSSRNRKRTNDSIKYFTTEYLLNNLKRISNTAKGLNEYIVKAQIENSPRDLQLNESNPVMHENVQIVIVEFTPRILKFKSKILLKVKFQCGTEKTFCSRRSVNKVAVALLECLDRILESSKVFRHSVLFIFDWSETWKNELQKGIFESYQSMNTTDVFIEIDSLEGNREMLVQTYSSNLWLLNAYLKSFEKGYVCLICNEITRSNEFSTISSRTTHTHANSNRLHLLYTYTHLKEKRYINEKDFSQNILSLIQYIDGSADVNPDSEPRDITETIFYDFFGIFFILYSETDAIIINFMVSFFSLITLIYSIWLMQRWAVGTAAEIWTQFSIIFGIQVLSLAVSAGLTICLSYIYDSYRHLITWVPKYWLVFGIYFCPFIFTMSILQNLYLGWKKFRVLPLRFGIMLFLHVNCFIFVVGILTLTGLSVQTAFVIVSGIAFYTLALMVNIFFKLYQRAYAWIFPILIGQFFPVAFITYLLLIFYAVYIPVSYSSRPPRNIQLLLALSAIGFSMLMFGFMIPIIAIFRKSKTILCGFIAVMLVFLILIFTNMFII